MDGGEAQETAVGSTLGGKQFMLKGGGGGPANRRLGLHLSDPQKKKMLSIWDLRFLKVPMKNTKVQRRVKGA